MAQCSIETEKKHVWNFSRSQWPPLPVAHFPAARKHVKWRSPALQIPFWSIKEPWWKTPIKQLGQEAGERKLLPLVSTEIMVDREDVERLKSEAKVDTCPVNMLQKRDAGGSDCLHSISGNWGVGMGRLAFSLNSLKHLHANHRVVPPA